MEKPRLVKSIREISIREMPEDLRPFATTGMGYVIKTDGKDATAISWMLDKYLISLSQPYEIIEKGTEVVFIE